MKIRWTRPFAQNLEAARDYITADNPTAAASVIQRILEALDRISRFPEVGRASNHMPGIRHLPVPNTPLILVYRIQPEQIELLALWHHAQKWPRS
jgi:addiction module RelE/StbE family toxin